MCIFFIKERFFFFCSEEYFWSCAVFKKHEGG